ncbi:uncharacterized protein N7484_003194 [Penicillium longicatenatum]|uniref:uncharacterized protein n=1 Tax=Penicillium longicatenatum TaxID=1561947 RepID=UPI0025473102|nr:uncharacterized protein N7484_003194 [Penicillium longicatenatum]KAJ5649471.1 hypothetical protein N7484_003194 [Penicillium longicatenatum]
MTDLSYPLLHTQWSGMRTEINPVWFHVHVNTGFRNDAEWKTRIREIKETANRLGVSLLEKTQDTIDKSSLRGFDYEDDKKLKGYFESELLSGRNLISDPTHQAEQSPEPQSNDNQTLTRNSSPEAAIGQEIECLVSSNGKICAWCHKEGAACLEGKGQSSDVMDLDPVSAKGSLSTSCSPEIIQECVPLIHNENERLPGVCSAEDIPRLLFRWSNVDSQGINSRAGFRAGLFAKGDPTHIDLDQLTREEFLKLFKKHVTKTKVPSPFISTFTLPLSPVHRALHNQKGAIVTIIDSSKLESMVVKAQILVPLTETETKRWKGYGEYLIWREIPKAAIACVFTINQLKSIARRFTDIGKFLQLKLIRSRRFSGMYLYCELARKLKHTTNHCRTLERLVTRLGVPLEYRALTINRFELAWTRRFGDNLNIELAEDRASGDAIEIEDDVEMANEEIWTRHRSDYKGEEQSGASTYVPSQTDLDHSSESEEQQQEENDSASPEAPARRRDTSSPPFSTRDSADDEPWNFHQDLRKKECPLRKKK